MKRFLLLVPLLMLAGCELPAETFWSPDGTKAAYMPPSGANGEAMVFDENGKILAKLGPSLGGFAWSPDSRSLYFATAVDDPAKLPKTKILRNWANSDSAASTQPATQPAQEDKEKSHSLVSSLRDGKVTPLIGLPAEIVWYMTLSPDGKWLAIRAQMMKGEHGEDKAAHLYVYSMASSKLYLLSSGTSYGAAFTASGKLVFVEPGDVERDVPSPIGQLVAVTLDESAVNAPREELATVVATGPWVDCVGEDILLTSQPVTLPSTQPLRDKDQPVTLYRYARSSHSLHALAADINQLFKISPDGKLVLLQKLTRKEKDGDWRGELAVLELASGAQHVLNNTAVESKGTIPESGVCAYPAWRTGDQISFYDVAMKSNEIEDRICHDLVLFKLTPQWTLEPVRTLSKDWPPEIKPSFKKEKPAAPAPAPVPVQPPANPPK